MTKNFTLRSEKTRPSSRVKREREEEKIFLVLHNIRSAHNVGAIFRTADAAGAAKIFLTGYTPSPRDALGNYREEIKKTALGAERFVAWEARRDAVKLVKMLRSADINIVALEQAPGAVDYRKFKPRFPLALIVGNEVRGLSKNILRVSDAIIKIPMHGKKESLNVSVAAGIALFALRSISKI